MKYLTTALLLSVMYNTVWALYSASYYGPQQQLSPQQQIQQLQQQIHLLQQQQGQGQRTETTNLKILLPKAIIDDFEYTPTVQGYRFGYQLPDGSRREEKAFISGLRMDDFSQLDSKTVDFNAVGVGGRPKMKLKNRKLSPGSLKALAG